MKPLHPRTGNRNLTEIARSVVEMVNKRLPADVRSAATAVHICYDLTPSSALIKDGVDSDTLGLFVGSEFGDSSDMLPSQIIFYLRDLWEFSEGDESVFREETKVTYLHELGHFLGWDEAEIERQGLE